MTRKPVRLEPARIHTAVGNVRVRSILLRWGRATLRSTLCYGSTRLLARHTDCKRFHSIAQRRWLETETIGGALCINGAGAYRGAAVLLEFGADGRLGTPDFVSEGATRVLA